MKNRITGKKWSLPVIFCLLSMALSGCFLDGGRETLDKDVLRVGMNLNIEKMCYLSEEDNQPEGFEVELAQILAEKMGMELEIVDTTQENLLKSLDGEIYDCVLSGVGLGQWNQIHYGHTQPYLDISSVQDQIGREEEDTQIAAFTKKGNSLAGTLEEKLEALKEDGTLSELSGKYFGKDITLSGQGNRKEIN